MEKKLTISDIDLSTKEGKLLWASVVEMSTGYYSNLQPDEIMERLEEVFDRCHPDGKNYEGVVS